MRWKGGLSIPTFKSTSAKLMQEEILSIIQYEQPIPMNSQQYEWNREWHSTCYSVARLNQNRPVSVSIAVPRLPRITLFAIKGIPILYYGDAHVEYWKPHVTSIKAGVCQIPRTYWSCTLSQLGVLWSCMFILFGGGAHESRISFQKGS
jgi:hypothetical protein